MGKRETATFLRRLRVISTIAVQMEKAPVRLSPEHQDVLWPCLSMGVSLVRKGSVLGCPIGLAPWSTDSSRGLRTVWISPQEACYPGPPFAYHPKKGCYPDLYNHLFGVSTNPHHEFTILSRSLFSSYSSLHRCCRLFVSESLPDFRHDCFRWCSF